ncbi:hypothetical protein D3C81_1585660 [compost metagenome]
MANTLYRGQQFGQQCFVGAAAGKIRIDRVYQSLLIRQQGLAQAFQPLPALGQRRHWVARKCFALGGERGRQVDVGLQGRHGDR